MLTSSHLKPSAESKGSASKSLFNNGLVGTHNELQEDNKDICRLDAVEVTRSDNELGDANSSTSSHLLEPIPSSSGDSAISNSTNKEASQVIWELATRVINLEDVLHRLKQKYKSRQKVRFSPAVRVRSFSTPPSSASQSDSSLAFQSEDDHVSDSSSTLYQDDSDLEALVDDRDKRIAEVEAQARQRILEGQVAEEAFVKTIVDLKQEIARLQYELQKNERRVALESSRSRRTNDLVKIYDELLGMFEYMEQLFVKHTGIGFLGEGKVLLDSFPQLRKTLRFRSNNLETMMEKDGSDDELCDMHNRNADKITEDTLHFPLAEDKKEILNASFLRIWGNPLDGIDNQGTASSADLPKQEVATSNTTNKTQIQPSKHITLRAAQQEQKLLQVLRDQIAVLIQEKDQLNRSIVELRSRLLRLEKLDNNVGSNWLQLFKHYDKATMGEANGSSLHTQSADGKQLPKTDWSPLPGVLTNADNLVARCYRAPEQLDLNLPHINNILNDFVRLVSASATREELLHQELCDLQEEVDYLRHLSTPPKDSRHHRRTRSLNQESSAASQHTCAHDMSTRHSCSAQAVPVLRHATQLTDSMVPNNAASETQNAPGIQAISASDGSSARGNELLDQIHRLTEKTSILEIECNLLKDTIQKERRTIAEMSDVLVSRSFFQAATGELLRKYEANWAKLISKHEATLATIRQKLIDTTVLSTTLSHYDGLLCNTQHRLGTLLTLLDPGTSTPISPETQKSPNSETGAGKDFTASGRKIGPGEHEAVYMALRKMHDNISTLVSSNMEEMLHLYFEKTLRKLELDGEKTSAFLGQYHEPMLLSHFLATLYPPTQILSDTAPSHSTHSLALDSTADTNKKEQISLTLEDTALLARYKEEFTDSLSRLLLNMRALTSFEVDASEELPALSELVGAKSISPAIIRKDNDEQTIESKVLAEKVSWTKVREVSEEVGIDIGHFMQLLATHYTLDGTFPVPLHSTQIPSPPQTRSMSATKAKTSTTLERNLIQEEMNLSDPKLYNVQDAALTIRNESNADSDDDVPVNHDKLDLGGEISVPTSLRRGVNSPHERSMRLDVSDEHTSQRSKRFENGGDFWTTAVTLVRGIRPGADIPTQSVKMHSAPPIYYPNKSTATSFLSPPSLSECNSGTVKTKAQNSPSFSCNKYVYEAPQLRSKSPTTQTSQSSPQTATVDRFFLCPTGEKMTRIPFQAKWFQKQSPLPSNLGVDPSSVFSVQYRTQPIPPFSSNRERTLDMQVKPLSQWSASKVTSDLCIYCGTKIPESIYTTSQGGADEVLHNICLECAKSLQRATSRSRSLSSRGKMLDFDPMSPEKNSRETFANVQHQSGLSYTQHGGTLRPASHIKLTSLQPPFGGERFSLKSERHDSAPATPKSPSIENKIQSAPKKADNVVLCTSTTSTSPASTKLESESTFSSERNVHVVEVSSEPSTPLSSRTATSDTVPTSTPKKGNILSASYSQLSTYHTTPSSSSSATSQDESTFSTRNPTGSQISGSLSFISDAAFSNDTPSPGNRHTNTSWTSESNHSLSSGSNVDSFRSLDYNAINVNRMMTHLAATHFASSILDHSAAPPMDSESSMRAHSSLPNDHVSSAMQDVEFSSADTIAQKLRDASTVSYTEDKSSDSLSTRYLESLVESSKTNTPSTDRTWRTPSSQMTSNEYSNPETSFRIQDHESSSEQIVHLRRNIKQRMILTNSSRSTIDSSLHTIATPSTIHSPTSYTTLSTLPTPTPSKEHTFQRSDTVADTPSYITPTSSVVNGKAQEGSPSQFADTAKKLFHDHSDHIGVLTNPERDVQLFTKVEPTTGSPAQEFAATLTSRSHASDVSKTTDSQSVASTDYFGSTATSHSTMNSTPSTRSDILSNVEMLAKRAESLRARINETQERLDTSLSDPEFAHNSFKVLHRKTSPQYSPTNYLSIQSNSLHSTSNLSSPSIFSDANSTSSSCSTLPFHDTPLTSSTPQTSSFVSRALSSGEERSYSRASALEDSSQTSIYWQPIRTEQDVGPTSIPALASGSSSSTAPLDETTPSIKTSLSSSHEFDFLRTPVYQINDRMSNNEVPKSFLEDTIPSRPSTAQPPIVEYHRVYPMERYPKNDLIHLNRGIEEKQWIASLREEKEREMIDYVPYTHSDGASASRNSTRSSSSYREKNT